MEITFYDRYGRPIAYTEDNAHIYLFDGSAVAYISGDSIYGYSGKHLGFFQNGWVRDHSGNCVFFTEISRGSGPVKPVKSVRPVKSVKSVRPVKGVREVKPVKSVRLLSWSDLSGRQFFNR